MNAFSPTEFDSERKEQSRAWQIFVLKSFWSRSRRAGMIPESSSLQTRFLQFSFVPAVKALLAQLKRDRAWSNVRPPLIPLSEDEAARLLKAYDRIFSSPDL